MRIPITSSMLQTAQRGQHYGNMGSAALGAAAGAQSLVGDVLAKEVERRNKQSQSYLQKAMQLSEEAQQLTMPKPQQPLSQAEGLGGAGLLLLLSLLGVKGKDLNEFGGGFIGARQGQADQANAYNMQDYQNRQRLMGVQADNAMTMARYEQGQGDQLQGRLDQRSQELGRMREREQDWTRRNQSAELDFNRDLQKIDKTQSALNYRAEMRDPRKVEAFKALGKTPEGRAKLTELAGLDADAAEAARQLNEQEKNLAARTATEDALRDPRVAKVKAETQRILGGVELDDARRRQIEQRIAFYPLEYQVKVANTYSLIHTRSLGKQPGANDYYGKGDETKIRSGYNAAQKTIAELAKKKMTMGTLTPEDAEAFKVATADMELFGKELAKISDAKIGSVRDKYGNVEMGPQSFNGGNVPLNPMQGAITGQGVKRAPKPTTKPKPAPKPGAKTQGKTSGNLKGGGKWSIE